MPTCDRQVKWNLENPLQSDDGTEYSHITLHTEEQDEFNFVTVLNCKCGRNAWQLSRRVRVHSAWQAGVSLSQMRCEGWTNHLMQVKISSRCQPMRKSGKPLWPKHNSLDQYNQLPIKGLNEIICLCETEIPRPLAEPIHHPEPLKSILLAISQISGHF